MPGKHLSESLLCAFACQRGCIDMAHPGTSWPLRLASASTVPGLRCLSKKRQLCKVGSSEFRGTVLLQSKATGWFWIGVAVGATYTVVRHHAINRHSHCQIIATRTLISSPRLPALRRLE